MLGLFGRCLSVLSLGSLQLNDRYEQLRLQVVDFHVSVLTTCLQHADYLASLAGDLILRFCHTCLINVSALALP